MFIFAEGHSQEEEEGDKTPTNSITYIQRKNERKRIDTSNSLDEFVLLWTEIKSALRGMKVVSHTQMWQLHCMETTEH